MATYTIYVCPKCKKKYKYNHGLCPACKVKLQAQAGQEVVAEPEA